MSDSSPDPAPPAPLAPELLYRRADLSELSFTTTADLAALPSLADQPRAEAAIRFGIGIDHRGFNIVAIGSGGARLQHAAKALLDDAAAAKPQPPDWVYVNNFSASHKPVAIALPGGRAPDLRRTIHHLIDDLRSTIATVFNSEDYQKRRAAAEQAIQARQEAAFATLNETATERNIAILRTPMGFAMAPMRDGKVVPPADFNAWPKAEQQAVRDSIHALESELEQTLRAMPRLEKEQRDALRALDRETASFTVAQPFEEARARFSDLPKVLAHFDAVRADVLDNVELFRTTEEAPAQDTAQMAMRMGGAFDRYEVNVFVTHGEHATGGPVVEELHPTLGNLVGRVEYLQMQGALLTNFRLIKPGALHRANGGTLLIDVRNLLMEPFSWTALKRTLLRQEIAIEDVAHFVGLTTTVSLEPDPIPLNVKIVLFGDRQIYYLLAAYEPDLAQHFKVLADFDDDVGRSPSSEAMLARMIGSVAAAEGLRPLDRPAVARAVEHAARLADDADKLTLLAEQLHDLVAEADHWAAKAGRSVATRADVEQAIEQQIYRAARVRERSQEMILRDIALIDTKGSCIGQLNGLSVLMLGGYAFGRPSRITCRVRPGNGRIVDIEREVELGGPLHSKGVLILSGFLSGRYALDAPMSLSASLVFEQSYGGVEGDSASSAELYALLSAISGLPLRQDLAVTGSVNQHGQVQAIGGVNEKIEGFFDICTARGLTGTQGVLIPQANVQHLMLRADVVAACSAGRFAIHAVRTIDEGIALLTGMPAGIRNPAGGYPPGTVNAAVETQLNRFAELRRRAGDGGEGEVERRREKP
ncbi:MAG: AAA family ATPase [Rhodospirillales bacterium]|nr:AAA family ATPase [Rhodospirillales bacterium]